MNNNSNSNNVRPDYYNPESPYEPLKVIDAWGLGFRLGNAVKYISRAGKKKAAPCIEDLKKARTYLDLEISKLEEAASIEQSPVTEIPVTEPASPNRQHLVNTVWESNHGVSWRVVSVNGDLITATIANEETGNRNTIAIGALQKYYTCRGFKKP